MAMTLAHSIRRFAGSVAHRHSTQRNGRQSRLVPHRLWSAIVRLVTALIAIPAKLLFLALIVGCAVVMAFAYVESRIAPSSLVVVQQFEISSDLAGKLALTGKSASDLLIDDLNRRTILSAKFRGSGYYDYSTPGVQNIAVQRSMKVPVQSSYGITLGGVSIDNLIAIYNQVRYQQSVISGNIFSSDGNIVVRTRVAGTNSANFWDLQVKSSANLPDAIQKLSASMLTDINPELVGRAYLQNQEFANAEETFRHWALASPSDPTPFYYLSLAYDLQGKEKAAICLARWSQAVSDRQKVAHPHFFSWRPSIHTDTPEELAAITTTMSQLDAIPVEFPASKTPGTDAAAYLPNIEALRRVLHNVYLQDPGNLNHAIQYAKSLHKEATIRHLIDQSASTGARPLRFDQTASDTEHEAVGLLDGLIARFPENGGLHEQQAIFLQELVEIDKAEPSKDIHSLSVQEALDYKIALLSRPASFSPNPPHIGYIASTSPLWGYVYAQTKEPDTNLETAATSALTPAKMDKADAAADLAYTVTLLDPTSMPAQVAYIYALEASHSEQEALKLLPQVLNSEVTTAGEFETLWRGFQQQHSQETADLIAKTGRQHFPHNVNFKLPDSPQDGASPPIATEAGVTPLLPVSR